jgi:hypothetical protein
MCAPLPGVHALPTRRVCPSQAYAPSPGMRTSPQAYAPLPGVHALPTRYARPPRRARPPNQAYAPPSTAVRAPSLGVHAPPRRARPFAAVRALTCAVFAL